MHTIHAHFSRFRETPIDTLLHAYGVYVLWDGRSQARPCYIGEGDIWARLTSHRKRFSRPISGYLAILDEKYSAQIKRDCQILEATLLEIGSETDRTPTQNRRGGNLSKIESIFNRHGVMRLTISGYDPLTPPAESKVMTKNKIIRFSEEVAGIYIDHPWRLRKIRS